MFTISREGVQDADRDGLLGANRSNSLAIARICNNADRPIPRLHTRVEIVNTLLGAVLILKKAPRSRGATVLRGLQGAAQALACYLALFLSMFLASKACWISASSS